MADCVTLIPPDDLVLEPWAKIWRAFCHGRMFRVIKKLSQWDGPEWVTRLDLVRRYGEVDPDPIETIDFIYGLMRADGGLASSMSFPASGINFYEGLPQDHIEMLTAYVSPDFDMPSLSEADETQMELPI